MARKTTDTPRARVLWLAMIPALFALIPFSAYSTHIRAGEITVRRLPGNITLTFEITVTGYRDTGSQIRFGGNGRLSLGDGTVIEGEFQTAPPEPAGNEVEKVYFTYVHTYQAPNADGYLISYQEEFRNEEIANMSSSVSTTFYVETLIVLDPLFGLNNSPILTVPPVDFAAVGARFIHNPGAYDPDGDSLTYHFTTPKQARDFEVNNYRRLNDRDFYEEIPYDQGNEAQNGPPELTLDPVSGDLVWDAPGDFTNMVDPLCGEKAEYNVAFVIEEWREVGGEWFRLGYVVRDMQIIVCDSDNERPTLEVPDPICVEAGTDVVEIISGNDPDGDPVKLEAFGGPFEINAPASYTPNPATYQGPPGFLTFTWETECGHVRANPYEVQFKVTDRPEAGPRLAEIETWEITVVGPAPTGLQVAVQPAKSIQLNWDLYGCTNADSIQIWRRTGEYEVGMDECVVGMPPNTGYELIDRVSAGETGYLDDNNGKGLAPGAKYCYRLVAEYPLPEGGLSYVSEEACDSLIIDVPVITHVDVLSTSRDNGEILVRWTPPYQIDQGTFPPAYTYDVVRAEGLTGTAYESVATGLSDTVFIDSGINTLDQAYNYKIVLHDDTGTMVDSSASASSVRLHLRPLLKAIELTWSASVPWSNRVQDYPYHYIYRDEVDGFDPDQLVLIDSVNVAGSSFSYLDNGAFNSVPLDEDIEYCYYVTTYGSYGNELLPEPLINNSQVICGQPNDTIAPCAPPRLTLEEGLDCETIVSESSCGVNLFQNEISWTINSSPDCDDDLDFYNIYFSSTGREEDYEVIATTTSTHFVHDELSSFKGCYRISAVDRSGNESELTEQVCNDNCPVYKLPNVFTPNGDGYNDMFTPLFNSGATQIPGFDNSNCPRFVREVLFKVFNRNGRELFSYTSTESESDIYINWDGKNNAGEELPSGVYYYVAEVTFDVLNPEEARQTLNGWVQILK